MSSLVSVPESLPDHDERLVEGPAIPPVRTGLLADSTDQRWQRRLLPVMIRMVVGLTFFFFAASLAQLIYLNRVIERVPQLDLTKLGITAPGATEAISSPEFRILASLDASTIDRRYHQANVQLMARLWTSYLGFVTGMILALVGAVFILGKLRVDASELNATGAGGSLSLRSSSPGLLLAALGVGLMIMTIVTYHPIQTADSPVFVGAMEAKPVIGTTPARDANSNSTRSTRPLPDSLP